MEKSLIKTQCDVCWCAAGVGGYPLRPRTALRAEAPLGSAAVLRVASSVSHEPRALRASAVSAGAQLSWGGSSQASVTCPALTPTAGGCVLSPRHSAKQRTLPLIHPSAPCAVRLVQPRLHVSTRAVGPGVLSPKGGDAAVPDPLPEPE